MSLNLRTKIADPIQTLITLFSDRSEKVNKRYVLEKEITDQNGKLTQQLQEIFKLIARRTNIGFHLKICDEHIEVSTEVFITRVQKKQIKMGGLRLSLVTIPIRTWLTSPDTFNSYLLDIEKAVRLLSLSSLDGRQKGKVAFSKPHNVTVSIDTRNRYF